MKKKSATLPLARQLTSVPLRNQRLVVTPDPDGRGAVLRTDLVYPAAMRPLAIVLRLRTHRQFRLDGLGWEVFQQVDGRRTFEEQIDHFARAHALGFLEARSLLMQYMATLMQRGLIVVGLPGATT